jgi:hypothetical protein
MTVGDVKQHYADLMQKNMAATEGFAAAPANEQEAAAAAPSNNPALANLTLPDRMKWLTHAQSLLHKDLSEEKATLQSRIRDTMAAYQTGKDAPDAPTLDDYTKLYGNAGNRMYAEQLHWQQFGHDVAGVNNLPFSQQGALLKSYEPTPGEGYAQGLERYGAMAKAIDYVNTQRKNDPMGFWQKQTGQQELDFTNPQTLSGPLAARFIQADQASRDYGLPYQPFSVRETAQLGPLLDKAPVQQVRDYLGTMAGVADTPDHYRAAMEQLAPNNPMVAVAGQHAAVPTAPGQVDVASLILQGDRLLNPTKAQKDSEGHFTKIPMPAVSGPIGLRTLWETSVGAAYGSNFRSSEQDFNAAMAYYAARMQGKESENLSGNVWAEAVNAVAPHAYHAGVPVLVPLGSDPDKFESQINKVWPDVLKQYGLDAAQHPAAAYPLVQFNDGSYAVTNGTSTLYGADGRPVRFNLDGSLPVTPADAPAPGPPLAKKDALNVPIDKRFR